MFGTPPSCGAPVLLPCWEWRTFTPPQDSLRAFLELGDRLDTSDQRELALICLTSSHEVTIHEGRLHLRWRKQVSQEGLELWDVVLDAPFPCTSKSVHRLFEAWNIPCPTLRQTAYTLKSMLHEVIEVHPSLRAVEVERRSEYFSIQGARCEWSRLHANHVHFDCLSIEHEDPSLIHQIVRSLDLQSQPHTSYLTGLKSALHLDTQH